MSYDDALKLATKLHKGQVRKYGGAAYITHPIAVASKFTGEIYKTVAILHDVVEDTEYTLKQLSEYGFSDDVVNSVSLLTKKENVDELEHLLLIKENDIAKMVKIEDLTHNLLDLKEGCQKTKYILSLYILNN